jgi:hypothetical protein
MREVASTVAQYISALADAGFIQVTLFPCHLIQSIEHLFQCYGVVINSQGVEEHQVA